MHFGGNDDNVQQDEPATVGLLVCRPTAEPSKEIVYQTLEQNSPGTVPRGTEMQTPGGSGHMLCSTCGATNLTKCFPENLAM